MTRASEKKVLFIVTKSDWGGAQRYVYDLATALPKDEFAVSAAFGQPGLLAERLGAVRITMYPISSLQREVSAIADVKSFFELLRLFRAKRFDVVHLNSSKAAGVGALAARLAHVPRIVFTAHGWPFMEKRNLLWRLFALLGSWATALLSHAVITVSRRDLELGRRMPFCRAKMRLIHNGIDLRPAYGSGAVIRRAFLPGARITGTVGELTRNKNQITLIEQARGDPNLFVAIVGEGEERARLEEKIREYGLQDRVKLFGFLPAREALRGFDAFILPSIKEGLPYALLEAKVAGLPITANRVGGVGEILDAKDMSDFSLERMLEKTIALYH